MRHDRLFKLILAALMAALSCVATMLIQIPIPATNGYINLGDGVVLLGAFLLGSVYGFATGGIGSMLADIILGYAVFAPGSFLIKGLSAYVAARVLDALRPSRFAACAAGAAGEAVMVTGYFAYEALALGYGSAAVGSVPGNAVQGAAGVAAAAVLYKALRAVPMIRNKSCI